MLLYNGALHLFLELLKHYCSNIARLCRLSFLGAEYRYICSKWISKKIESAEYRNIKIKQI